MEILTITVYIVENERIMQYKATWDHNILTTNSTEE